MYHIFPRPPQFWHYLPGLIRGKRKRLRYAGTVCGMQMIRLHTYVYPCVCTLFSCLGEWKHPNMTSYSRIPQLPPSDFVPFAARIATCMERFSLYVYIYSPDMDIQKYTVTMKIIVNSVKISSPIGTISNSEVVDLQY